MPTDDAALVWLRRDLRLSDHAALAAATRTARRVHCAFVFDTEILDRLPERADRRVEFIWASVSSLKQDLESHGASLHVLHGPACRLIPDLAARLGVDSVHAARDYEPFARSRDAQVAHALAADGRRFFLHKDQVIFETDEILTASGRPYHVFTPYSRVWLARLGPGDIAEHRPRLDVLARTAPLPMPSLEDLGFVRTDLGIEAGEAGAQARLADFLTRIDHYHERRDYPAVKGPSYLSVHLRFGTVSVRQLVRLCLARGGEGARTWLNELIWREFYQMLLWHHPHTVEHALQAKFDAIAWPNPPGHYEAWCAARTGYPLVDAAMRQLNSTGYMHNRLRMLTASFLVKDLHVDWRLGERYFARKLIDYDQAANVGSWQWAAGVGTDAQPWFRIFNPVTQSRRYDPAGRFIRRYVPELAALPDEAIHAPWLQPAAVLAAHGIELGRDYPPPIVDHARARARTLALFKAVA
ncbi:MAG: deoxyribodipyrimidine photo-lyase [Burkholderiales bacterium]|nr:deoxyribodipyrimidine photo-lyase [Burkholderiales bacterium]